MAITIKPKIEFNPVNIEIPYDCAKQIMNIRDNMSSLDAIKVLRYIYPKIGLLEAKSFVEKLDV